ncbi:MAG: hypothetical protein R2844_15090 [Caldilineales bacterium]
MRQWQANEHDEGALLRGAPLVAAETWLAERGDELSPAMSAASSRPASPFAPASKPGVSDGGA